ncbi:hypothetical protein D9615_003559 [Tricholomella constricta]|uniref:Phosphatidylinositol transfer protein SFH5 n=1 Tax=Tricholomella constricta TaxID=117010 RepID=A0A8H5HHH2_9AGAR|nr:hypothetical protein D9615_003559 [Tricholomella constricta]
MAESTTTPTAANALVPTPSVSAEPTIATTPEATGATVPAANDIKALDISTSPPLALAPTQDTHAPIQTTATVILEPTKTLTAAASEPGATPAIAAASSITSPDKIEAVSPPEPSSAAVPLTEFQSGPQTTAAAATPVDAPSASSVSPGAPTSVEKGAAEEPEAQNTLTGQFTEAEWAALRKFRAELPQIFADGFPDDPKANETPITFWGVEIDPNHPRDARISVILMKFLRARNLSIPDAREMLVSTLRWRTSINLDAVMKEEFPQNIFGGVGHIFGRDKEGRPVVYNIYGANNLSEVFGDVQRFIRWRVALQEKSVAMLDFNETDQMIQIHDYLGVSLTSRDAKSKAAASEATNIFQSHYPELLYRKFFVNVPTLMNWIFWVFKPLIPAATLAKMSVVGTGHHALKKALVPFIDARELPKQYGGDAAGF